jgi:hypothetical protein
MILNDFTIKSADATACQPANRTAMTFLEIAESGIHFDHAHDFTRSAEGKVRPSRRKRHRSDSCFQVFATGQCASFEIEQFNRRLA